MIRNIIIVNDAAHITGGAGKVALESAKALSASGFHIVLFSAVGPVDESLIDAGIDVICLNQYDILSDPKRMRAIIQGVWNEKAYKRFQRLLSQYSNTNTLIHFHAIIKSLSPCLYVVAAKYNFKMVVTLHDYFLFCPNGGLLNYQKRQICKMKPSSLQCLLCNCDVRSYPQKIWRFIRQMVETYSFKKNRDISLIYISKLNYKICYDNLKEKVSHWYFLQNPIDLNQKSPIAIENNDTYLFIGRISEEKGIALFCQAVTDLNLRGLVLGDGYLREDYQRRYPNIQFAGWVTGDEKDKLLRRGKALIFPSLCYEGAPLTIIEMKSYGLPCIVPDLCAAAEEIEDGKTGYIFKSGSLISLENAIRKYERADVRYFQNNILNNFSSNKYLLSTHCKKLIEIYNSISRV